MTAAVMVTAEGVSLAFLLVVLLAYLTLPRSGTWKRDGFFYSLALTMLSMAADLVAWVCELSPSPRALQYAANFIALITTGFIVSAFGFYIVNLIREKKPISAMIAKVIAAVNLLGVIALVVAAFRGTLFEIEIGPAGPDIPVFNSGGIVYELPFILSTLSLIFMFALVLRHSKSLGRRKIVVFSIYFLLPMIAGVLEVAVEGVQLTVVASAVSLSIIYMMLQSSRINEMILREQLLNEVSYVDQLTGLLNRRACDRDMETIREDDSVSVVFCDLNGLKRINDTEGHRSGDRFLVGFAKIMLKHFPHEFIYRISGDEFLVVARNMDKKEFENCVTRLREEIDANAGIAALGTITGSGGSISDLVKRAETSMYDSKKEFYRRNPEYRR